MITLAAADEGGAYPPSDVSRPGFGSWEAGIHASLSLEPVMTTITPTDSTTVAMPPSGPRPPSKSASVIKLLSRTRGATAAELCEPTGWQPHSVRAYLTGLRKKGLTITREKRKTGETAYRIDAAAAGAEKSVGALATA